jgi:hypothetical protein
MHPESYSVAGINSMMKVIRKEILIAAAVTFGVMCLLAVGLYFLLVHPRSIELRVAEAKLASKRAEVESLSAETVKRLKAQAEESRSDLSQFMVLAGQQGELSIKLRQLAAENRLGEFSNKDVSGGLFSNSELQYIAEQRINISFSCDFMDFARFLHAVEKNRPEVFVDGFSVTHDSKDDTRVSASMESTVFYEQRGKK